jgi:hypothetical protein
MKRTRTDWQVLVLVSGTAGVLVGIASWQRAVVTGAAPTFDGLVLASLAGTAIFAAVLAGGHFAARDKARGRRGYYAVAGALAGLLSFAGSGGAALIEIAAEQQLVSLALGLPLVIGALLGIVYDSGAGIEDRDEARVEAIEQALEGSEGAEPALIDTGEDQYFSGPMQVRFSLSLMFASGALLGLILAGIGFLLTLSGALISGEFLGEATAARVVGMTVAVTIGTGVLMVLPTLLGHYAATFFKARTAGAYVGYGFLANIALGLVTGVFLVAAPFAAATLALYRRLAGIEPVGLPDDIRVRDPRALVAADHPARRYHRVVGEPKSTAKSPPTLTAPPTAG